MTKPEKPKLSKNFTIDDIHKIREYHYELREYMGKEEYDKYAKEKAERGRKRVEELKKKKVAI